MMFRHPIGAERVLAVSTRVRLARFWNLTFLTAESAFRTQQLNCAAAFPSKIEPASATTYSAAIFARTYVRGIAELRHRPIPHLKLRMDSCGRSSIGCLN